MLKNVKQIQKIDPEKLYEYVLYKLGKCSQLKIQKLLYYIQGYHLAYLDEELISDDFEAWVHGPVLRDLFHQLKGKSLLYDDMEYEQGENEKHISEEISETLTTEQIDLIDEVIEAYGKFTGNQLESFTHSEYPWINARKGYDEADICNEIISKDDMTDFFKRQLYSEEEKTY